MNNLKNTKRALISSVIALFICFAMLLGSTYAWFTDTAVSANNKIVAGTLDVELWQHTATGSENISDSNKPVFTDSIIWEPGQTETVYLSIRNNGNLELKYKVLLVVTSVSHDDLTKVMEYAITPDATYSESEIAWNGNGTKVVKGQNDTQAIDVVLQPGDEHFFALSVHMLEEAGNEYMGETITFDIKVFAAQAVNGDETHDAEATYPNVSRSESIPANATAPITFNTGAMNVTLSADALNSLPEEVEKMQLYHSEARIDTNSGAVVFDSVDFFDQNGAKVDFEAMGNTAPIEVTIPVGDAFAPGTEVKIYHDGEQIDTAVVDENGNVTYEALHFCEVSVEERVYITVTFTDGYTKNFKSLASAMRYGYSGGEQEKITVYEDIEESMGYLEGNIVCGKEGGVTIKNTIVDEWIYCDDTNFTIGEGVTYDVSGAASGLFVYGSNCVINGTVITDCYYQRYGNTKLTINATGSMTVKTEQFILRYTDSDPNAGIYINGDNDDSTVELNLAVAYFYQGMISAKDATLKVGTYWQTNGTDGHGSANLFLDNSKLTVTVNEHNFKATGNSTVTLINGSVLNVAGGIETTNEISVDGTSTVIKAR